MHRSIRDLAVYARLIDNELVLLLVSTDDFIISTKSEPLRLKVVNHLKQYFPLTTKEVPTLDYLSYRIIQSSAFISLDQTPCILSFTRAYFKIIKSTKTDIPFLTDRHVEDEIANASVCDLVELNALVVRYGEFQSNYGTVLHCSDNSRPDFSYSMAHLGHFINIHCLLGCLLMHKVMCYLHSHPNKPLIFPK